MHEYFKDQTMLYWRISGYIHEDEVNRDFYCLDQVIKRNTNDKEFIPWIEKLKTDLPVVYINVLC